MRERPILFSGPMVRAILAGTKTQTRRVVKPQPAMYEPGQCTDVSDMIADALICPYGRPGDRLWVRESTHRRPMLNPLTGEPLADTYDGGAYSADGADVLTPDGFDLAWWYSRKSCPSIHMPRSACRLVLEITGVRVERLQAMTLDDLCEEGIGELLEDPDSVPGRAFSHAEHAAIGGVPMTHIPEMYGFAALWDSLNGPGAWKANPWVWVVEFRPVAARQQQEGGGDAQ